jgi:hypothetical protein
MDQIFGMAIALGRFHCASKNPGRKLSKTFKVNIEPKYCSPNYQHTSTNYLSTTANHTNSQQKSLAFSNFESF